MPYTKGIRYNNEPSDGGNHQLGYREIQTPAFASSVKITTKDPLAELVKILFAQITGAMTLTADVNNPWDGDIMIIKMPMDSTGRTVTFSTGFTVTATTIVGTANSICAVTFMFDAQSQTWVETARAIN